MNQLTIDDHPLLMAAFNQCYMALPKPINLADVPNKSFKLHHLTSQQLERMHTLTEWHVFGEFYSDITYDPGFSISVKFTVAGFLLAQTIKQLQAASALAVEIVENPPLIDLIRADVMVCAFCGMLDCHDETCLYVRAGKVKDEIEST